MKRTPQTLILISILLITWSLEDLVTTFNALDVFLISIYLLLIERNINEIQKINNFNRKKYGLLH